MNLNYTFLKFCILTAIDTKTSENRKQSIQPLFSSKLKMYRQTTLKTFFKHFLAKLLWV